MFLAAGIFFQLTAMSYAEGAALHQERGGSAVFARYAFNELVSFIAGWAIVLDYTILVAVTALAVPSYLAVFWAPIGRSGVEIAVAFAVIAFVALDNLAGVSVRRLRRRILISLASGTVALVSFLILVTIGATQTSAGNSRMVVVSAHDLSAGTQISAWRCPGTGSAREPGIHTRGLWLWIPALAAVAARPE